MKPVFQITNKDKKTNARIGILNTKKGAIETPFFMPVATKATAKYINSKKIEELGANAIISNGFLLSIKPGVKIIKKFGGLGKFMNFKGINFTDSGGFQMYSKSIYLSSNEQGVFFRNPLSGEKIFMTPEKDMQLQFEIGSDVAMCLDRMPLYEDSKEEIEKAVKLTSMWANRCKKEHDKLQKNLKENKRQLLFGIIQGGIYKDLREKSANQLVKLNFDGYAIGGIALPISCYENIDKAKKQEYEIIKIVKKIIPGNKICYVMGEGDPVWMLEMISLGVDCFDSKYPTESARRGTLFTSKGKIKILNKKYESDKTPIDKNCRCFVCQNYSKAYIRFLLKEDEPVGKELASHHNLYYLQDLMKEVKEAIDKGKFGNFKEKVKRVYKD